jgi:hypothetical protein
MAISTRRRETKIIIFAGCDACGQIHAVPVGTEQEFIRLRCPVEAVPLYRTLSAAREVFAEVQKDLMSGSVAA